MVNFILSLIGVMGAILTAYGTWLTREGNKVIKENQTIDWNQIILSVNYVAKCLKKDKFVPDYILAAGNAGGIVALLLENTHYSNIGILTGYISKKKIFEKEFEKHFVVMQTNEWVVYYPKCIDDLKEKKVLIVDDSAMTGYNLNALKNHLIDVGYSESNIKTFVVAVGQIAIEGKRKPDYCYKTVNPDSCHFPWG